MVKTEKGTMVPKMKETVNVPKSKKEILEEVKTLLYTYEEKRSGLMRYMTVYPFYVNLNGVCTSEYDMPIIPIRELEERIMECLLYFETPLAKIDTEDEEIINGLFKYRLKDLIEFETQHLLDWYSNMVSGELEKMDIKAILKENKNSFINKIENKKIKQYVKDNFEDILELLEHVIRNNYMSLEERKLKFVSKSNVISVSLQESNYKQLIECMYDIEKIEKKPMSLKTEVIQYLLKNITHKYLYIETSILSLANDMYDCIEEDLYILVDTIKKEKINNIFDLDIGKAILDNLNLTMYGQADT